MWRWSKRRFVVGHSDANWAVRVSSDKQASSNKYQAVQPSQSTPSGIYFPGYRHIFRLSEPASIDISPDIPQEDTVFFDTSVHLYRYAGHLEGLEYQFPSAATALTSAEVVFGLPTTATQTCINNYILPNPIAFTLKKGILQRKQLWHHDDILTSGSLFKPNLPAIINIVMSMSRRWRIDYVQTSTSRRVGTNRPLV